MEKARKEVEATVKAEGERASFETGVHGLNAELVKLDRLKGIGALIGEPEVLFVESENPVSDMVNGDFVWHFNVTNTPPFKSGTARVTYTDEGFAAFFE